MRTRVVINWGAYRRWYKRTISNEPNRWFLDEAYPLYKHERQNEPDYIHIRQGSAITVYIPKRFVLEEAIEND